jgi:hypothetical protein
MSEAGERPTHLRVNVIGVDQKPGTGTTLYNRHDQTACGELALNVEATDDPALVTCPRCHRLTTVLGYSPSTQPSG